jgi:hypothetical protein
MLDRQDAKFAKFKTFQNNLLRFDNSFSSALALVEPTKNLRVHFKRP